MSRVQLPVWSLILLFTLVGSATAQYPRYRPPAGSTLPSQLNYFRRDTGVLDNYNTFIEPQRQAEQRFRELQTQQSLQFRQTSEAIQDVRRSSAAATGSGGTFFNSSHYYPGLRTMRGQ